MSWRGERNFYPSGNEMAAGSMDSSDEAFGAWNFATVGREVKTTGKKFRFFR